MQYSKMSKPKIVYFLGRRQRLCTQPLFKCVTKAEPKEGSRANPKKVQSTIWKDREPLVQRQGSQPHTPKLRSQAKDPKPKIPSQKSQAKDPKPKIPSQRSQAKDPKPKISSQRSQAKDPKKS